MGLYVEVKNPNSSSDWTCESEIELKLINDESGAHKIHKLDHSFCVAAEIEGVASFMSWDEVVNPSNGFLKGGAIFLEADISVKKVTGVQDTIGKSEEQIGWFHEPISLPQFSTDELDVGSDKKFVNGDLLVIINCEDTSVAVHQSSLMKESVYFKALLEGQWSKNSHTTLQEDEEKDFSILRVHNIVGFSPIAVKALFDHVEGHSNILNDCTSFDVLGDMLLLCDYYMMSEPEKIIIDKIKKTPVTIQNLVLVFETGKKLESHTRLRPVADFLIRRCISFAGTNFPSWQSLLCFIVNNTSKVEEVLAIIQLLGAGGDCVLRYRFHGVSSFEMAKTQFSPDTMYANMIWRIGVSKKDVKDKTCLGVYLCCNSEEAAATWTCKVEQIHYNLHKHTLQDHQEMLIESKELNGEESSWGSRSVKLWSELIDKKNGYVEDDAILVEIRFKVMSCIGYLKCLGIPEKIIR
eukprot:TRINITY_DN31284_c0_g1_i6.p1 TRINITY_DN31284_c0_g1~~TRINITY_DN31284_c0_g1_i6.p1  ORF type:complete len:465 (-),score=64.95 TRINITY_DN31284_c0_g1_i6:86-1480(-)